MKKYIVSLFILLTAIVLVACGNGQTNQGTDDSDVLAKVIENGELNVGIAPGFAPYEFYIIDENGERKIVGSDVDLANAIADEIGVELKITESDFNGVIANIQAGSVDMGVSGFTYTEKRTEVMQFSTGYLQEAAVGFQGIMMHQDVASEYNSLDAIKEANLTFGAQGGSIQYELAGGLTDKSNIKQYNTLDNGLAALNEGDIDAMVVSTSSAEPMLLTFNNLVILPQDGFDLDPDRIYSTNVIAFPLGEEYQSLIELTNKVIEENIENGNIAKWQEEAKALSQQAVE